MIEKLRASLGDMRICGKRSALVQELPNFGLGLLQRQGFFFVLSFSYPFNLPERLSIERPLIDGLGDVVHLDITRVFQIPPTLGAVKVWGDLDVRLDDVKG
ncbi:hypothetical protein IAD21_00041 [Abditibacteriota bacterium]|nr:hypothetical protein IAD21_00041 [Abditibacteriota bacterium]